MIAVVGAMEGEVAALKEDMEVEEVIKIASMQFFKGVLCGKEAVIVQSGIGKVNAAMCAQILADKFAADTIINTGIAGSLNAEIEIGDMVISHDTVQHDMDVSVASDSPVGQIPGLDTLAFPADERLVELAKKTNEQVNPNIQTFVGRIVSGDQFIACAKKKQQLIELFDAHCTEMEGAAIAHVAYLNKIPYVIIRAISDKADNSAQVDYADFEELAIAHSIRLVQNLLPKL